MAVHIYLVAGIFVLLFMIYHEIRSKLTYWERKGIQGPEPQIPYGNFKTLFYSMESIGTLLEKIYKQYPEEKVVGIYQVFKPVLIVRDPDLVKRILIKDFGSFKDRGVKIVNQSTFKNIAFEDGDTWSILRQKHTPLFTSGKLKSMMRLTNYCVNDYMKNLDSLVAKQSSWEIRSLNMKYTIKAITAAGFGLDVEACNDEKNVFVQMAQKIFTPSKWSTVVLFLHSIMPGLPDKLGLKLISPEIERFFKTLVNHVTKQREGNPNIRKDFMDLMIRLKEEGTVSQSSKESSMELKMTDDVIMAQAAMFYSAGTETSAETMSFILYELALNPSAQDRCFKEIKEVMAKYNEELTYESLKEFQYTNMAFNEALRKHPVGGVLFRQTVKDYTFPEINLTIPKGMKVIIPVPAMHMDEQYFPDPESFQPERFAPENKSLIRDYTYLPFGDGPRNCIGMRLAKMQLMLGIVHFLYRYRVEPCDKTVKKIRPDPLQIIERSLDGIWLNIVRR